MNIVNWIKKFDKKQLEYLCLFLAGFLEFVYMAFKPIGVTLFDLLAPLLCMFYMGAIFFDIFANENRNTIIIGILFVVWFCITYCFHLVFEGEASSLGRFMISYMIALPFASICNDDKKGIKIVGNFYILYTISIIIPSLMLFFNVLPESLSESFFFLQYRLHATDNPNIIGMSLTVGIIFSTLFILEAGEKFKKAIFSFIVLLQYFVLILTNSRTCNYLCCAFFGAIAFYYSYFKINKKNDNEIKNIIISLMIGLSILVVSYMIYTSTFNFHVSRYISLHGNENLDPVGYLESMGERKDLWFAGINAIIKNPMIMLVGTDKIYRYIYIYI